jgi:hypothetical protein
MAKQTVKRRDWTKEDVRILKMLIRENAKTTVIARRLKRSVGATYQQASKLGPWGHVGRSREHNPPGE